MEQQVGAGWPYSVPTWHGPSVGTVEQALPQTTVPHTAGRPYLRPRIGIDAEISILYVAPASRKVKSTRTAMFRMRIGDHNLGVGPLAQP